LGSHPLNLAIRFLLELCALFVLGLWAWRLRDDSWRIVTALAVPLVAAALWGTFAVPGDPSRSGSAPVVVPGALRLMLEFGFFASATWTLNDLGFRKAAAFFAAAIVVHYLLSYDRIRWLLSR
jgi:hypothetical protein